MCLRRGLLILLPDLDGLIRLPYNQPHAGAVERRAHNAGLGIQGAGLGDGVEGLEPVARLPVPEAHAPVVAAGEEDVLVEGERVDDGVVAVAVAHEGALGALPLLDAVGAARGEGELGGVDGEGADALLVVGEHAHGLAGRQVPEPHRRVERAADDLRVRLLALDVGDRAPVAGHDVDVAARAHVPHPHGAVAAARDEHVEGRVQRQRVHAAQVAVVVADDPVGLEIPALDHLVLAAREQVRVPRGYGKAADCGYVSGQSEPQVSRGEIPYLDGAVAGAAGEPLVVRLDGQRPDPAQMARDDPHQLPRGMPLGLDLVCGLGASGGQSLGWGVRCVGAGRRPADLDKSGGL